MPGLVFPWRADNRFVLLNDGPLFFPRMLTAIDAAQHQVELELYLLESGACTEALITALAAAAQRGVTVRCLFDDFGARSLLHVERERLLEAGVQVRWYNPLRWRGGLRNFYRDHRKMLLVDRQRAFVGGTCATDAFWQPGEAQSVWREVMVDIAGPLVLDWQQLFDHQWQACRTRFSWKPSLPSGLGRLPLVPAAKEGVGRVAYADARQHRDIHQSLVRALQHAQGRIWLVTPYFLPTWKVRRTLRKAAARGVEVRLLLSGRHTDNPPVRYAGQRYYPRLLKAGVRIFEYQPRFLHMKIVLVDEWVSVGSCNFDHWNLRFNLDANLESLDPTLIAAVTASLEADFLESREVDLERWHTRPWWRRAQQRLWGWVDRLVVNLLDRRR